MDAIFIGYRRDDFDGHARRLFDRLRQLFDAGDVFFDVDGIDAGDDFPERLDGAARAACVVFVVIGRDWLRSLNERAVQPKVDYLRFGGRAGRELA